MLLIGYFNSNHQRPGQAGISSRKEKLLKTDPTWRMLAESGNLFVSTSGGYLSLSWTIIHIIWLQAQQLQDYTSWKRQASVLLGWMQLWLQQSVESNWQARQSKSGSDSSLILKISAALNMYLHPEGRTGDCSCKFRAVTFRDMTNHLEGK